MLTSLDATLDRSAQNLSKGQTKKGSFFNKMQPVQLRAVLQVAPSMRRTHDQQQRYDVRQYSLYIPGTEQMEHDTQWNKHKAHATGGGVRGKNRQNNIWQGFIWRGHLPRLMDLRQRINLLIEVTFAHNSVSSLYFKHVHPWSVVYH